MTALLDHPAGVTPLQAVESVHTTLDHLAGDGFESLSAAELGEALVQWQRVTSRIAELRHRLLRAADQAKAAAAWGASDTGAWAAGLTHLDPAAAAREVQLARALAEVSPAQVALAAGAITTEHASVITHALLDLPANLDTQQRTRIEQALTEKAAEVSPRTLRAAARRALETVEPDPAVVDEHENDLVRSEEDRALEATTLTLHDNGDGTITGRFTIPVLQGHLLRKILDTITSPRRAKIGATKAHSDITIWPRPEHARGLAFTELLEHLPTDRLTGKSAVTVVVNLDHHTLINQLKASHLDTGAVISAGQARRLACNAGIIPTVLGGDSLPLDLGRTSRLFTENQRIALSRRHQTCTADGCERPFAWCELHHHQPWNQGGPTNLNQAIPLCWLHHRRIHDPSYTHHRQPDGTITFHQRS